MVRLGQLPGGTVWKFMCVMQNGKSGRFFLFHNKMMKIKQTKIVEGETPMEMLLTV